MKNMKALLLSTCLLLSALPCIGASADPAGAQDEASARQFVKDFYDWYIPRAKKDEGASYDKTFRWRPDAFSKTLIHALKEDEAANKASKDGPVGLDSDPFLNAQDFCEKNEVGKATVSNNTATVEFFEICSGDPASKDKPWVIAELVRSGASWQFTNFKYQEGDLLSTLADLKKERSAESKRGK
jgi:hypothetical protein